MRVRTGVVGLGFIGMAHIEALRRLGFVDVIAVTDAFYDLAVQKASELGIPKAYSSYQDMLLDEDIDVIHVCTPNHLHFQVAKDAILAGKHVLSEKPLALNTQESAELVRLAKERGIIHAVNFNYRHFAMVQQLRSLIHHGELGDIWLVHGNYLQDWLLYDTDFNWRMLPEFGGKSRAVADIGSHWISTVQHVIGQSVTEVFGDISTMVPVRKRVLSKNQTFQYSDLAQDYEEVSISTEDYASILLRFNGGAQGSVAISQVSAGRKNHFSFEVNGSRASAFWDQEQPERLWIGHRDQPNEVMQADPSIVFPEVRNFIHYPGGHLEGWPDGMKNAMLNLYTFIREGKHLSQDSPEFETFEEGHRIMLIVEAILESSKMGQWVRV